MKFVVQGGHQPLAMHLIPDGTAMSRVIIPLLLAAGILFNAGCAVDGIDGPGHGGAGDIEFVGEVIYVPVEGGFYGIISSNGRKLNPMNLDESLKQERIAVEGVYRVREDVVGIRQWGTTVELIHQKPVY